MHTWDTLSLLSRFVRCVHTCSEVRCRRAEICEQAHTLFRQKGRPRKTGTLIVLNNKHLREKIACKKHASLARQQYTRNTNNLTQRHDGEQREKIHVDWLGNENQVCMEQDKSNGYMKNGAAIARKRVTLTAERRPNKESSRLRRKSWQYIRLVF